MYSNEGAIQTNPEELKAALRGDDLLLAQLRLVHENSLLSQLVALLVSTLLAYVQWPVVDHSVILVWLACMTAVSLGRLRMACLFHNLQPDVVAAGRWRRVFLAAVACSGLLWGAAGLFLVP